MMCRVNRYSRFVVFTFLFSSLAHASGVEFFSPTGEVKNVRQVAVRFSEQMVSFGDPRQVSPFDINCPAPGHGRWADKRNWVYDFDNDLPAGVGCTFTLKKGLVDLDGKVIEGGGPYSFNTGGPAIVQSEPREGNEWIDENQIFILGLDAPAKAESIEQNAACLVDGIPEQIPVKLITGKMRKEILDQRSAFLTSYYSAVFKRGRLAGQPVILGIEERGSAREKFLKMRDSENSPIVVLQCQRTLPNDTNVSLLWGKGIQSTTGIPTSQAQKLPFKIRHVFDAKFSCERVNKDADCIPVLPMSLQFSASIKKSDARKIRLVAANGKVFQPAISGDDNKDGFVDSLTFPSLLPERTEFKIDIPAGLKDDAGRVLANASSFPLKVRTDENPPIAKFAATFGILELHASPSAPPLLPVTLRNVGPQLAASLATVKQPDAIAGQVSHTDSQLDVVRWLYRLNKVDETTYHYDQEKDRSVMDLGPGMTSVFEKGDKRKPFKIVKPLEKKAFEVVGIPLKNPGFYVVELESPRLGEALLGQKRPYYVHAAALVTNLSVHFKLGGESSLVWVTSLDKGQPVKGADVAVRDCSGEVYYRGRTDSEGILRVEKKLPDISALPNCTNEYDRQYFVTAKSGNDFSFVFSGWNEGISLWRFNAFQTKWEGPNIAHAVMDRTLFRSGETVHMKLFLRKQTRAGFAEAEIFPENITIFHQGGEEKYQLPVKWDKQGTAVLDWNIPKDAKQGTYVIQVPQGARRMISAGSFRVESFRIPLMKAVLQGPVNPMVNGDKASIGIQINYLSGGGAAYLPVKVRGKLIPKTVTFPDYEDYVFANGSIQVGPEKVGSEPWYTGDYELSEDEEESTPQKSGSNKEQSLPTQNLKLDGAGSGKVTFTGIPKSSETRNIQAEVEYSDPNGEILTTSTMIPIWPSKIIVGLKPAGWITTVDHLKFIAIALDLKGHPVTGAKMRVVAMKREYYSHRRRLLGGFYAFENRSEIKSLGTLCQGATDGKGMLICDVKAPGKGNIILQAMADDVDGNTSFANREVWVAGDKDWWYDASDNDRVDLLPEKKRYEPGETARFQLRMPFKEATVLVTTEREGVMESFVTRITRAKPLIEVPIKKNYSPNVFISALAVRGRIGGIKPTAMVDLAKPSFKMGLAEINVGWAAHELKVKVATDKSTYKVREKAKVSVDVRRADGSLPPPGSEIALAAVDEGLLQLSPNLSWKLLDSMMRRRGIDVDTSTAQMQVIGKRHFGRKALPAGGGGGTSRQNVRELFDTLLFWQARIKLDEHGHGEAIVPLNDSLTSFRIVAVANGNLGLFGTGSASINTTQDIMLLSGLPPLVREQDTYRAHFTVRNASDHPIQATVMAKLNQGAGNESTLNKGVNPINVSLQPGEAKDVGWEVAVPVGIKELKWDVVARENDKGEDADHLRVTQKVITAIPVHTFQATLMQLEKPQSIQVKLPAGAIPGRGGVKVGFRSQLGNGLSGVQEFMSSYMYTCFEQNASKAVALQDEDMWNGLMKSLPSYLDRDGLVKYFPIMEKGSDTLTTYILSIANEAGYQIPADSHDKMIKGLTGFVEGRVIRDSPLPTMDLSIRKLAAMAALSREDKFDQKWLDSIAIEPNLWPTSAVLDWADILNHEPSVPNQEKRFAEAQQIIRSRLNFQGTTMGFSTERRDALWWLMINSDVNANRVLLTFLDTDAWKPDVPRLVQGTLFRQQHGHWNTTVANAWGVLAMKKFSEKFEQTPVTGNSTAAIGKEKLVADWQKDSGGTQKMLGWPKSAATLSLSHDGTGKPWVFVQSLAALPLKEPLFTGYHIERKIIPIDQKIKGSWHKGDVVRVHLDVESQSDMTWVVINDPIPAGATILGTGLGGDSKILTSGEKKRGWVWPAFEERTFDSFHAYYRFMPKGKMSVEYTLRLNNDGEFNLPTTRVEAMYAPEMFGELPNKPMVVLP